MTSGSEEALQVVGSLLTALSEKLYVIRGGCGAASYVKMVNQLLAGVHIAAAAEGMAFGARLSIQARVLFEIIQHARGYSWMFGNRVPHMLDECVGDDADFIIQTVPLEFEDDKFHAMDIQEDASSRENQDSDDFKTSQSEQSGSSSCKANRGDRNLDLSGNGESEVKRKDSVDNGAHGGGEAVVNSSIHVEFLRFEVNEFKSIEKFKIFNTNNLKYN